MGTRQRRFGAVYQRADGRWKGKIRIPGGGRCSFYALTRRDMIHRLSQERWALGNSFAAEHRPGLYRRYPASQSRS